MRAAVALAAFRRTALAPTPITTALSLSAASTTPAPKPNVNPIINSDRPNGRREIDHWTLPAVGWPMLTVQAPGRLTLC